MFKKGFILFFISLLSFNSNAQQRKNIEIKDSGAFGEIDEVNYPGARILTRSDAGQVHVYHDGIDMYCDQAVLYGKENFVEAYGNVKMIQGDTITMVAKYAEYSGKTQLAYAKGNVVLTEPSSVLTTQKLYFDRAKQEAFYNEKGKVVRDSSGTITSTVGRYYMSKKKYRFLNTVKLVNPEYVLTTNQLDFYSDTGHAYMFGPSKIVGETSTVYCERGFYNTNNDTGYFTKNSRIDYDNRVVEGDSMYFDRNKDFASASNNIVITDTINKSIIKGHYAEVYKSKDSAFVTKRALAISVQENDSIYIHSDTLMVTGKEDNRITRAFRNAKLYKSDVSGKADSIHVNHQTGLTKLINLSRLSSKDAFKVKRKPILWHLTNQITGDTIHLKSNPETEKLDSLIVFENAFIISKDTISIDHYSQIKGKRLVGLFDADNQLKQVNIFKNAESIFIIRNEDDEFVGLDKARSANIEMYFEEGGIYYYKRLISSEAKTYPEDDIPKEAKRLKDFDWREEERPLSVDDLFKDDPPLNLPIIKGLAPAVPDEEFFDEKSLALTMFNDYQDTTQDDYTDLVGQTLELYPYCIINNIAVENKGVIKSIKLKTFENKDIEILVLEKKTNNWEKPVSGNIEDFKIKSATKVSALSTISLYDVNINVESGDFIGYRQRDTSQRIPYFGTTNSVDANGWWQGESALDSTISTYTFVSTGWIAGGFKAEFKNFKKTEDNTDKPKVRFGDARDDKPLKASRQIPKKNIRNDIKRANPKQTEPTKKLPKKALPALDRALKKKK